MRGFTAVDYYAFETNPTGFADKILEALLPSYTELPWYNLLEMAYNHKNAVFMCWILVHGYNCLGVRFYNKVLWPNIGSIDLTSPGSVPQQQILAICLSSDERAAGLYFEDYHRQGRVEKGPDYYKIDDVIGTISDAQAKLWKPQREAFFAAHPELPNNLVDTAPARR